MNKKSIGVGCIYTGAILGAGFATGLELFTYFISYGIMGFLGLGLCCMLFAWIGYRTLKICIDRQIHDYSEFMDLIAGKIPSALFKILSFLFLNVMFSAMLAGFGELTATTFGIKPFTGSVFLSILCFFLLIGGTDLLSDISTLICPVLIIGCVILGIYIFYDSVSVFSINKGLTNNFITSAIIYTSYNTITSVSLLAQVSNRINKKKEAVFSSFICGMLLLLAGTAMALPLYFNPQISDCPLPILQLIDNNIARIIYIVVLTLAVVTTALGNGFCIAEFFKKHLNINNFAGCFIACIIGLMLSHMGFSHIVNNVYYIFGVIGLGQIVCVVMYRNS